jgi:hypothetical protein
VRVWVQLFGENLHIRFKLVIFLELDKVPGTEVSSGRGQRLADGSHKLKLGPNRQPVSVSSNSHQVVIDRPGGAGDGEIRREVQGLHLEPNHLARSPVKPHLTLISHLDGNGFPLSADNALEGNFPVRILLADIHSCMHTFLPPDFLDLFHPEIGFGVRIK